MNTSSEPGAAPPEEPDEDNSRATLIAFVFVIVLAAGGYWLFNTLMEHRRIEECIASGRRDCIPITTEPGAP
jgi:hypothetical protein